MKFKFFILNILLFLYSINVYTQGVAQPLTIQGLDRFSIQSARSQSMGGVGIGFPNNIASMFTNPAWLTELNSISLITGNNIIFQFFEQSQEWIPNELYAELSIIFENNELFKTKTYDTIKPNWYIKNRKFLPSMVAIGLPFNVFKHKVSFGIGISEFINLNHYFQNNNALLPNIGQMRPAPIPRPKAGDTVKVNWFQYINERTGNIYQMVPSIAVSLSKNFSIGASISIIDGKSDDLEYRNDRGFLKLTTATLSTGTSFNNITLDSVHFIKTYSGNSDYRGIKTGFGLSYKSKFFSVGFTFNPKFRIERRFTKNYIEIKNDSTTRYSYSGEDNLLYPASYYFGIALYPTKKLLVGFDLELKNFNKAVYSNEQDTSYQPWLNCNNFKFGIEYNPIEWLSIRTGYRDEKYTVAAEGAEILQNPISGSAISTGIGIKYLGIMIDLAYENIFVKYQDTWLSNINTNKIVTNKYIVNIGYEF